MLKPPRWMNETQAQAFHAIVADLGQCVPIADNKILHRFAEVCVISADPKLSRGCHDRIAAEMHLLRIGLHRQNAEACKNG